MEIKNPGKLMASAAIFASALAIAAPQAQAGQLYNGWNYGIDAFNDGSGGSAYEIKGLAIKETADSIFVALTGGTPLTGVAESRASDRNIGWGDLFFNFSGKNFATALQEGSILGVRFAATNDSGVSQVGLYGNVVAQSVTSENNGYGSLQQYYNAGYLKTNTTGTDLATKQATYNYLYGSATPTSTPILNSMKSGTFLGGIDLLGAGDLLAQGLNFGNFNAGGSQTFGFQLDKSLLAGTLPGGISAFMAHVLLECGNDAVALAGTIDMPKEQEVPEPTTLLGLGSIGLAFWGSRKRRTENA